MENTMNKALVEEKFRIWKTSYFNDIHKEELMKQEKERKEKEFQKKVEAANKFRLKKTLLYKHMIFRRIKRVLKAENKWLQAIKQELTVYHKKRFFRYWKIYYGMVKLDNLRMQRTGRNILKALKDHAERNKLNEQIAIAYNRKIDQKKAFDYWLEETRGILHYKKNKANANKFYSDHLKKNAFKMFKEYLSHMRRINQDEFLKLGEKQDFFEIGITQVMMHKY